MQLSGRKYAHCTASHSKYEQSCVKLEAHVSDLGPGVSKAQPIGLQPRGAEPYGSTAA